MTNVPFYTNEKIHQLLLNLSKDEFIGFRQVVERTFEDFSIGGERGCQPEPSGVTRPNGQRTLFRPFTSDEAVGTKIVVEPPLRPDGKKDPLHGTLILLDGFGNLTGLLAAEEVTGFRTSMNVMVPFSWRRHVQNIVIFGSGMQALWHTRLILALRGDEVESITYVAPADTQVDALIKQIKAENDPRWKSSCSLRRGSSASDSLKAMLQRADCVFCTTPSKALLFPANYLIDDRSNGRLPFISAIGSWQPDMIELDPALLHHSLAADGGYNPTNGENRGVVFVDDREYALKNSGEIVQSKIKSDNMVELGQIVALMRAGSKTKDYRLEETENYISQGFMVYKSVGLSLTDLTVSNAILSHIQERQSNL
ncbi:hypothetical protein Q7P37_008080 [Cladosporium fusiforme]